MNIQSQVIETVVQHGMIAEGDTVVLAVSGGADSLAMLHLLAELRGKGIPSFTGHVAHLHHGMRAEQADADAEFVRQQAQSLGMAFHLDRADVPGMAQSLSMGKEEAGRLARYAFFRRVADRTGAQRVATAHQAADNVETVLMRVTRGMTFRALAGIPPVRPIGRGSPVLVIRPLIDCRRAWIDEYLAARGLAPRQDATNYLLDNLRNRIRQSVLPRLEGRMLPGVSESILHSIHAFRRARRGLAMQAAALIKSGPIEECGDEVRIPAWWLASLSKMLASEVLHQFLLRRTPDPDSLTIGHHERLLEMASPSHPNTEQRLPGGMAARREYDMLVIASHPTPASTPEVQVSLNRAAVPLPGFGGVLAIRPPPDGNAALKDFLPRATPSPAIFDRAALSGRLAVRAWRHGDRMTPLNAPGERKLQDIFTDLKVPRSRRNRVPVLTLDDQPIWVIGLRVADSAKVTPQTVAAVEIAFHRA